jgi:hypothetical protein
MKKLLFYLTTVQKAFLPQGQGHLNFQATDGHKDYRPHSSLSQKSAIESLLVFAAQMIIAFAAGAGAILAIFAWTGASL